MRVAIYEPEAAGHHMALYVRSILREMIRREWEAHLVTTERAARHPAYRMVEGELGGSYRLWKMEDKETPASAGDRQRVADQFVRWGNYRGAHEHLLKETPIDAAYMVNLDQADFAMALRGSPFGSTPFAGMMIGRHFHCPAQGIRMAEFKLRDRIMGPVFRRLLRIRTLRRLAVVDPTLRDYMQKVRWRGFDKVAYVPDVASLQGCAPQFDYRASLGVPSDRFLILAYGALSRRKGVVELVNALASDSCRPEASVLFAGRQDEFTKQFLSEGDGAGLRSQQRLFELDKFLDEAEEASAFAACDAVWLGYRNWYGMSAVLVQAAAAGKPALAMDQGLIAWLVEKHDLGVTSDMYDPRALAASIEVLMQSERRAEWSENGRRLAASHTPELFGAHICDLIIASAETAA